MCGGANAILATCIIYFTFYLDMLYNITMFVVLKAMELTTTKTLVNMKTLILVGITAILLASCTQGVKHYATVSYVDRHGVEHTHRCLVDASKGGKFIDACDAIQIDHFSGICANAQTVTIDTNY